MIVTNLISPHPARGADLSPRRGEKIKGFLWSTKGAAGLASPCGEARRRVVRGGNFLPEQPYMFVLRSKGQV